MEKEKLNLNLLHALYSLLTTANVTRAAEQMHLTQSAMSRNLAQLREYFNDPLLVREGSQFFLTARATALLPKLKQLIGDIDALLIDETFTPAQCERRFVLASSDYVAQYILPQIVQQVYDQAPQIKLNYRLWEPDWLTQLGHLPIDLVSTMNTGDIPENLHGQFIGQDYPVCLMSKHHPLASQSTITVKQLLAWPFVTIKTGGDKDSFLDHWLSQQQLKRQITVEVPFFSAAFSVLTESKMLLVIPLHIAINACRYLPLCYQTLPVPVPEYQYHLLWHRIHHNDPAHQWFRQQVFKKLSESMYSPIALE
ncbi:LysR family transcriptional regulator [Spartinivicinus ruber]|uniref:LysR family transcriptional regulator n=1 Tax=Spartinivicinus ruber TaxID=2683272 RepID=UPI0013D88685|nr:LysR family transcriptional regulator [Spartinivicinus ruber]